jgi:CBS domain-containing protein
MLTARAIMTNDVVTIHPEASIKEAIELLIEREISGLPVVDDDGHLIGVVTEFALLAMVYDHDVLNHPVSQHMTQDLITVDVDDPVTRVADLCIVHRIRRVPVTKRGRLVGLIARRDVLRTLYESTAPVCTA